MSSLTSGAMPLLRAATRSSGDSPLIPRSSAKMASNFCTAANAIGEITAEVKFDAIFALERGINGLSPDEREDGIELLHGRKRDRRDHGRGVVTGLRGSIGKLEQLAPRMRPACGFRDRAWRSLRLVERAESGIGVGLKDSGISGETLLGMHAAAIGRVEVHCGRRVGAAKGAIVPHIGPQPTGPGLHLGQYRHRGVIAMESFRGEYVSLDQFDERQ